MPKLLILLFLCSLPAVHAGPPPGHPDTGEAARILGLPDAAGEVAGRGRILVVLPSNQYVYLHLRTATGAIWVAGPRGDDAWRQGQQVEFDAGRLMRNWYSKKHQRRFDEVLFVPELRRLPEVL